MVKFWNDSLGYKRKTQNARFRDCQAGFAEKGET